MPRITFIQNFTENSKMLTNSDLGGDLTLIYDYHRKRREYEADFSEKMQRLDADYKGKSGKVAGDELEVKIQERLKKNPDLTYSAAFSEVQHENPGLVRQYDQEIHR